MKQTQLATGEDNELWIFEEAEARDGAVDEYEYVIYGGRAHLNVNDIYFFFIINKFQIQIRTGCRNESN